MYESCKRCSPAMPVKLPSMSDIELSASRTANRASETYWFDAMKPKYIAPITEGRITTTMKLISTALRNQDAWDATERLDARRPDVPTLRAATRRALEIATALRLTSRTDVSPDCMTV